MALEFKQLEVYVRAVELRSFSKAAETLYLSQPSVSLYVGALERELGVRLLVRSSKEVFPTEDGAVFYEYAKNLLTLREQAAFVMRERSDGLRGEVSIAASSVPAQFLLPGAVAQFAKEYPHLSFSVSRSGSGEVVRRVAAQTCELGVAGAQSDEPSCAFEPLCSEQLVLVAPPSRAMRQSDPAGLLTEVPFVAREPGSGTRTCYETFLRTIGVDPERLRVSAVFSGNQSVLRAVSEGLGVSIVSGTAAQGAIERGEVAKIDLSVPLPTRSFYLVYHKNVMLSTRARLFAAFLKERFGA